MAGNKISTKTEKTFAQLAAMSGVKIPVLKKDENIFQLPIEEISPIIFDSICETQAELLSAITSATIHTILWKGNTTLIDFVATAGTFKLIYCQHYSLLGKNSTLVSPAGKNVTIYGDIDCATPATGGYSWILNSTATSSIKCKWIRNSGTTGKVGIDAGTVLYERIEAGIFSSVVGGAFLKQEFWDNTNDVHKDVSDNQNIWYLDTVKGLDTNSGLSRSAPKKTGDAVVIACKTAGKTTGRLVVMAGSVSATFTAANWVNSALPFFDVFVESVYTQITWTGFTLDRRIIDPQFRVINGIHTFNECYPNGYNILHVRQATFNSGYWQGQNSFEFEHRVTFNAPAIGINSFIKSKDIYIPSMLALHGSATIQSDFIFGEGIFGSYNNDEIYLNLETNVFSLEGSFNYPSQAGNSSIKITAAKMQRTATTRLLYLGAVANKTVSYQIVVDTMGSIVPMEIANPAGTVSGKVIELLKYENKVDSEISRATAAEALKADLVDGFVPSSQLHGYVDDVVDAYVVGSTPFASDWLSLTVGGTSLTPESGKIYIVLTAGIYEMLEFRWSGTVYGEISKSIALGETSSTAYRGDRGKAAYDHSLLTSGNPHAVTKSDVGLGNVDNVSDVNKPVSTAQAAAIAAHADLTAGMHGLPALDHFVYGDTIYGGSIVDNLNTLARTMPFTCFGTATGAPSADYSWFGWHINSNAGVAAAVQILWAFNSSSVICYERVKTSNMWGTWELQGTTGTVRVDSTNSPFAASGSATTILASTNTGDVVITMPAFNKKQFNVKWDEGVHNLTIVVANGGMIDGQSSYVVNDLWAVKTNISLLCKESGIWFIV